MKLLVEKRTLIFIALAILTWALIATGATTYYYLEQLRYQSQLAEKQGLLTGLAENYTISMEKEDMLLRDYNALFGEYYQLFSNLGGNYTHVLNTFPKLNETYAYLLNQALELGAQDVVTRTEFEALLSEFHKLLSNLAAKELEKALIKVSLMHVNLCINYGNETIVWYNVSASPGMTLFDLTKNLTNVEYGYYPWMEPGHVLVNSINGVVPEGEKYWFWYYWDETNHEWVFGQVGCDAWILKDNGTYRWIYKLWGS
ncbi:MAG: hypothetical protein QHH17_06680 [Candidatus Bathyarchaeota archaeon]|nr:hypothetical protein [Candidatus Bathyarchaeota archaeon]